jgi:hypothetical protein
MVDPIPGVSGAACHVPELNAILINRNESPDRRRADLAHELFRILTWDAMKPERVSSLARADCTSSFIIYSLQKRQAAMR